SDLAGKQPPVLVCWIGGLKKSHKILDHMGSTELAANLCRTPRQKRSCEETTCRISRYLTGHILSWGRRYGRRPVTLWHHAGKFANTGQKHRTDRSCSEKTL